MYKFHIIRVRFPREKGRGDLHNFVFPIASFPKLEMKVLTVDILSFANFKYLFFAPLMICTGCFNKVLTRIRYKKKDDDNEKKNFDHKTCFLSNTWKGLNDVITRGRHFL